MKTRVKVAMLRTNSIVGDSRILKELLSLSKIPNIEVLVLAWDREACRKVEERIGFAIVKHLRLKAPYRSFKLIWYLPIFWVWVFLKLLIYNPHIVQAINEETIIPAFIYRKFSRRSKLIFELRDLYSQAFFPSRSIFKLLKTSLKKMEIFFAHRADTLIGVSQQQLQSLKRDRNVAKIPNYPNETFIDKDLLENMKRTKSRKFRIVHAGTLRRDYGIVLLVKACQELDDVEAIFAGRLSDERLVKHISTFGNVQYMGELSHKEALALEATADVIPILCDPRRTAIRGASPNRLFEAMMLGIPVIINSDLQMAADIVRDVGCGIVTTYDVNALKEAILNLKQNQSQRQLMGLRGQRAFRSTYNWNRIEKLLLKSYEALLS